MVKLYETKSTKLLITVFKLKKVVAKTNNAPYLWWKPLAILKGV